MPASHHSMFTGQMLFLTPNQQYKSTEDNRMLICWFVNTSFKDVDMHTKLLPVLFKF